MQQVQQRPGGMGIHAFAAHFEEEKLDSVPKEEQP
jgi:hypothetical protein